MKKILIMISVLTLIALGYFYKKYYLNSSNQTIISEEPLAYTPEVEHKFRLARNAVKAFKENGFTPKIA